MSAGEISHEAVVLHNEALMALQLEGWELADALMFIYPDPLMKRTWLCNRVPDA